MGMVSVPLDCVARGSGVSLDKPALARSDQHGHALTLPQGCTRGVRITSASPRFVHVDVMEQADGRVRLVWRRRLAALKRNPDGSPAEPRESVTMKSGSYDVAAWTLAQKRDAVARPLT